MLIRSSCEFRANHVFGANLSDSSRPRVSSSWLIVRLPALLAAPLRSVPDCAGGNNDVARPRQSRTLGNCSPRTVTTRLGSIGLSNFSKIGAHFPFAH